MRENMEVVVTRISDEAEGVRSFELARADNGALPPFEAGAHIDVHLPGVGVRQYSLLNDDREHNRYVIAVLRESKGRGGSRYMHDHVCAGMGLTVGIPRNAFRLEPTTAPIVLVAGGIGVTPILAMARRMSADGRPFSMHYVTRSIARTPFYAEIGCSAFASQVRFYQNPTPRDSQFSVEHFADDLPRYAHVYACGPTGFMDAISAAVKTRGDVTIHTEYFAAPKDLSREGGSFEVTLARTGVSLDVREDESIANVLQQHGVEINVSCEQGICGTCLTPVCSGEIDHRDYFLSHSEQACGKKMLICVSRGKPGTTITLDI